MSRLGKKVGRKLNRQRFSKTDLCDVTLNDFANSSVVSASDRMKKNNFKINLVVKEGKNQLHKNYQGILAIERIKEVEQFAVKQLNLVEDDQTWEEKLNVLDISDKVNIKDDITMKKLGSQRRRRTIVSEPVGSEAGIDYPIDIWFLISEHIYPEDVGKFAAICKTSLAVVSTAKFWFNLYKRHYRRVANLPQQFQPECMVRRYGLRAHVIRALHFMYPPFIAKLKPQMFDGDPHLLTKRLCILAWSQKIKNHWLFCFKLKQLRPLKNERAEENKKIKPDLLELLEDITANVDDDCKVLQVTCLNYIILPMLSGQILSSVSLNVAHGMRYHRLQLNFGSGPFPNASSNPMILEPVVNVRILDWWHPLFPHSDGLNTSLFSAETTVQQFDELEF